MLAKFREKFLFVPIVFIAFAGAFAPYANAQMMGSSTMGNGHTAGEEAGGKAVWEKLQAKQASCADLGNEDFGLLGEYFMGQMMGRSHSAMNQMMANMMGEAGEEQAHVAMGKRLSGCDPQAAYPAQGRGFMSMMNMMAGGWSPPFGSNQGNNPMMGNSGNFSMLGGGGGLFMVVWWVLIIAGIIALVAWLSRQGREDRGGNRLSALDVLKERYAKGEIGKQEFEEKKKDLG